MPAHRAAGRNTHQATTPQTMSSNKLAPKQSQISSSGMAPKSSNATSASSAAPSSTSQPYHQYTLYSLADRPTCIKLFSRINALTPHPLVSYDNNHVITLQYLVQKVIQGRPRTDTIQVKMFKKSNEHFSVVRWLHDVPQTASDNTERFCDVKLVDECKFVDGDAQGLWFLQSLGATLKNEYVECNVVEYKLESGIVVRIFQLGRNQKTLDLSTLTPVGEAANQYIVEVRAVAQRKQEQQVEDAMKELAKELSSIVTLSKGGI